MLLSKNDKNTNEIVVDISASSDVVWKVITDTDHCKMWLTDVIIETDWTINSKIKYTCVDKAGDVVVWNDQEMIWDGIIKDFEKSKKFTCIYPNQSTGLIEETYELLALDESSCKLTIISLHVDEKTAQNYVQGVTEMILNLKKYAESLA